MRTVARLSGARGGLDGQTAREKGARSGRDRHAR